MAANLFTSCATVSLRSLSISKTQYMKKATFLMVSRLFLLIVSISFFASCKKEDGNGAKGKKVTLFKPVYGSKAEALASINGNPSEPVTKTGKIYIKDNFIYLNDQNKGIHVYDNSNPSNPLHIAFISIPGNLDIAIKGNTLYADMYNELLAINIADPRRVSVTKKIDNFFSGRSYVNGFATVMNDEIVVKWLEKDTVVSEEYNPFPNCFFLCKQ